MHACVRAPREANAPRATPSNEHERGIPMFQSQATSAAESVHLVHGLPTRLNPPAGYQESSRFAQRSSDAVSIRSASCCLRSRCASTHPCIPSDCIQFSTFSVARTIHSTQVSAISPSSLTFLGHPSIFRIILRIVVFSLCSRSRVIVQAPLPNRTVALTAESNSFSRCFKG